MPTVAVRIELQIPDESGAAFSDDPADMHDRIRRVLYARFPWDAEPGRIRAIAWELGDSPRPDPEALRSILALVLVSRVPDVELISDWSQEDCDLALDWAVALHLRDNGGSGVLIPFKPACLAPYV